MARSNRKPDSGVIEPGEEPRDKVEEASIESMDASDPPSFGGATGVGGTETEAADGRHRRIAERAHELWQAAGSPPGAALDFWLQAEQELEPSAAATDGRG